MSLGAVKVCGIVSAKDAMMVARVFREEMPTSVRLLLGMIIWPGSKRSIDVETARAITSVAQASDAAAVGIYVDEDAAAIEASCRSIGLSVAQLHGPKARAAVAKKPLPAEISVVDVVDVATDGSLVGERSGLDPLWTLYDAKGGGTGRAFDWARFCRPEGDWYLAGGLKPENVGEAVRVLRPYGIDVASGVNGPDGCSKDEQRLRDFLRHAWAAEKEAVV